MENLSKFCTCGKTDCPMHPTNHNRGCAPCIAANLKTNDIPTCFFNKVEGSENRKGDSFEDFAKAVLK